MNKLTTKINALYFVTLLILMISLIVAWQFLFIPFVKNSEQIKADLLLEPYAPMFEDLIDEERYDEIDVIISKLLVLRDEETRQPLVLNLKIELADNRIIQQTNEKRMSFFVNKVALFSPSTFDLIGSLEISYNDHTYSEILESGNNAVLISLVVFLVLFLVGFCVLTRVISPLTELSLFLGNANTLDVESLPPGKQQLSEEIKNVWQATQILLDRIHLREQELKSEHEVVKNALQGKIEAETASQSKSRFLANMSHEIRTPLTAIIGFAETLQDYSISKEKRDNAAVTIERNGKHLLGVINDILDLSKIESDKLEVEQLNISLLQLTDEVKSVFSPLFWEKGLMFEIDYQFPLPQKIVTDPTRLKQILFNLLSNAKKFTSEGVVNLCVEYFVETNSCQISVKDNGIGLTEKQMENIFNPFSQADSSITRKYGGTGLGLTISRRLAELLGGDLTVNSVEGHGAKFVVTFDVGDIDQLYYDFSEYRPEEDEQSKTIDISALTGKVLIAEDTPDIQELIGFYLESTSINITFANNGEEAVNLVKANRFDLVLMDIQMPVLDGLGATKTIREAGFNLPIIALTANAMREDRELYKKSGLNSFVAKPIDKQALYCELERYLVSAPNSVKNIPQIQKTVKRLEKEERKRQTKIRLEAKFHKRLPEWLNDIESALKERQSAVLIRAAHVLKGLGGSFGYPDITTMCAEIEAFAKNDDIDEANKLFEKLKAYCANIV